MSKYVAPHILEDNSLASFHCPHCNAFSVHILHYTYKDERDEYEDRFRLGTCQYCDDLTCWYEGKLVFPIASVAPRSHEDMPDGIKEDYEEARSILALSPRGSAALLRLCVQKLMKELGESGENINKDIASLVGKGLPAQIQKMLDIVRVIGNESVHPGVINLNDDRDTALALFGIINAVIDNQISQPKRIDELYNSLPPSKLDGIEKRDKK
ncbi:MAG: hypothetical protein Phog2KO_32050 [Phototrophicaceae bacterium]